MIIIIFNFILFVCNNFYKLSLNNINKFPCFFIAWGVNFFQPHSHPGHLNVNKRPVFLFLKHEIHTLEPQVSSRTRDIEREREICQKVKITTRLHPGLRLRISGFLSPHSRASSWCLVEAQLFNIFPDTLLIDLSKSTNSLNPQQKVFRPTLQPNSVQIQAFWDVTQSVLENI
jgi:hypothetical protein